MCKSRFALFRSSSLPVSSRSSRPRWTICSLIESLVLVLGWVGQGLSMWYVPSHGSTVETGSARVSTILLSFEQKENLANRHIAVLLSFSLVILFNVLHATVKSVARIAIRAGPLCHQPGIHCTAVKPTATTSWPSQYEIV